MSELGHILELTDEVEKLVAEGRWGEASAAETRRHALLVRYATGNGPEREVLAALHERSIALLAEVRHSREALTAEAARDFSGARAIGAYEHQAALASAERRD